MVWSRWVEDSIYSIFYRYDLKGCKREQEKLKTICMNELNTHPDIKLSIKTQTQTDFFIIQMALENLG